MSLKKFDKNYYKSDTVKYYYCLKEIKVIKVIDLLIKFYFTYVTIETKAHIQLFISSFSPSTLASLRPRSVWSGLLASLLAPLCDDNIWWCSVLLSRGASWVRQCISPLLSDMPSSTTRSSLALLHTWSSPSLVLITWSHLGIRLSCQDLRW